jgi:hypothetical protein
MPISRQRLGKHITVYACVNTTSIARQRISKFVSLTIHAVFSVVRAEGL